MTTRNQFRINPRITLQLVAAVMAHGLGLALAAQTNNPPPASVAAGTPAARLPDVVVVGESEYAETVQGPFLPDMQDTRINAGKKTSVLDLDELPKVSNNNYRQALTKTPGLLLSEETSPLVSVGYRGLAPHRAQFTQVLKDGIPIHADQFGYPEAYYTPPLDTVDRIEFLRGGTSIENVGRARHRGWEGALEVELFGLARALQGERPEPPGHQLSLYGNAMLLDAEFVGGPREGSTPQYAPDYLFRAGAIYRWRDRAKLAFLGTLVDDHYADDANTDNFFVPGYLVWDLTLDWKMYRDHLSILAGINNLFDEDYYARIRGDGIDPAYGRNFYAGLALAF